MSPDHTTSIIALGVFILVVGLIFTPLMTASNTPASETDELVEGNTTIIDQEFIITIENATDTHTNVTVQDDKTLVSDTNNLSVGQSATSTLSGGDVTTTVTDITNFVAGQANDPDTHTVTFELEYPRTYGWSAEGKLFAGQLDVLLGIIGFLIIIAVMVRVIFA